MEEQNQVTVTKSSELERREKAAELEFSLSPIGQVVKRFEAQQRIASMFAKSKIVPQAYQNNVADCAIAIDMAMRMDCNPLTVMQNLVIVQGRPTWQSQFLIACINKSGRFTTMQFEQGQDGMVGLVGYDDNEWDAVTRKNRLVRKTFNGENIPNYYCRAYATEIATGQIVQGSTIDVRMAIQERWYTKSGSKWQTMPRQMLIYRAAAFFQRAYCPEISMGFSTTDEIQDAVVVSETPAPSEAHSSLADLAAAQMHIAPQETAEPAPEDIPTNGAEPEATPIAEPHQEKTLL